MKRPHYAWFVCFGGALSLSTVMGLGANVYNIYQPYIISINSFTNAQGSWIPTTRSLFVLLALLTVNQLCARLSLRLVMTLGNVLFGLSCISFAFADSFPAYLFSAALLGIGYCYGGMVPLSLIIGNWFEDRRSLALGIASAGSGISTIFASPLVTWLIENLGLKGAFLCESAYVFLCAGGIWLLLRSSPEQQGLEPYRQPDLRRKAQAVSSVLRVDRPLDKGLVLLACLLIGGPVGPCFSHLTVLYTSEGFDSGLIASLISLMGLAICVGKILCGQIYDRFGSRTGNTATFGVFLAGLLLCCLAFTKSVPIAFAAMGAYSVGLAITAVSPAVWAFDLSTEKTYGATVRSFTVAYTAGMLLFGPIPGILADRLGSYVPSYMIFSGFLAVSMLLVHIVYVRLKQEQTAA